MKIVVFDTETTSLEKPFCYNIGYTIADVCDGACEILLRKDFVVEQVWHNPMLFTTAYYSNKREIYVNRMRGRKCSMDKFGYICQEMIRDFKYHQVELAFAYNSGFDEKVFEYNCEWFKCNNPFDNLEIKDIMNYVHTFVAFTQAYQEFCDTHSLYTESGNYSTTAESVYKYITQDIDFVEEHTALADSEIELEVLNYCLQQGATLDGNYKRYSSIPRKVERNLTIIDTQGQEHNFAYIKKRCYQDGAKIVLKNS